MQTFFEQLQSSIVTADMLQQQCLQLWILSPAQDGRLVYVTRFEYVRILTLLTLMFVYIVIVL